MFFVAAKKVETTGRKGDGAKWRWGEMAKKILISFSILLPFAFSPIRPFALFYL